MPLLPYLRIARPDHWFKNIFVLPGIFLVFFFDPGFISKYTVIKILFGFVSVCLVASGNYVLNEILDSEKDKFHPEKRLRPIPAGTAKVSIAYVECVCLAAAGLMLGLLISNLFFISVLALLVMGLLYNVRPVRLKDKPYADVLSESINNPIRMAVGWYSTGFDAMPPLSVLMAYWMFGAFLMATKRFAEYKMIGDPERAEKYRMSFGYYTEERLLESILFYAALFAMFSGVFMARYHIELVLATPLVAYSMAYYLHLGFKDNSPVQRPELLYHCKKLMAITGITFAACCILLLMDIPFFTHIFDPWVLPH